MKILSIDTSSPLCGAAILEDTKLLDKIELNNGVTHSESLMPLIKELLEKNNLELKDFGLLVCDIGPGSFTGIRIGIATVKAFSDSLNIPCIGLTSLETLAYNIKEPGLICSTIDCKNDNCYFALYENKNNSDSSNVNNSFDYSILEEPCSKSREEILNLLNVKYSNKVIHFVGDGIPLESTDYNLDVYNLGLAGFKKFYNNNNNNNNNNNFTSEKLLPLYLKKPQAQIQLEEKLKNN